MRPTPHGGTAPRQVFNADLPYDDDVDLSVERLSMRIALCRSPRKFINQHVRLRTVFIGQHRDDDDDQNKGNATKHNLVQHRAPADA